MHYNALFSCLIFAALPIAGGCRAVEPEAEADPNLYAYAQFTCAPWDGPALELILTKVEHSCANLDNVVYGDHPPHEFTRIVLYGIGEPETARSWTIDPDELANPEVAGAGWGEHCPGKNAACVPLDRAVVSFLPRNDTTFTVAATITFRNGLEEQIRYPIRECPRAGFFCG